MSRAPRPATPLWSRLLLAGASLLVPAPLRRAWRRQWEAEVEHYARRRGGVALARFTAGAWVHALSLR